MFIDAYIMKETAKSQYTISNFDYSVQQINKEIVKSANRGLTEVTMYVGYPPGLREHERSSISSELKKHGYKCRWYACGKPDCRLYISWRDA